MGSHRSYYAAKRLPMRLKDFEEVGDPMSDFSPELALREFRKR